MEKTVLEQALSEAEFCEEESPWGYPHFTAGCLRRMFRELLVPNNEYPVHQIIRTAIVDICTTIHGANIEPEEYGFDPKEAIY